MEFNLATALQNLSTRVEGGTGSRCALPEYSTGFVAEREVHGNAAVRFHVQGEHVALFFTQPQRMSPRPYPEVVAVHVGGLKSATTVLDGGVYTWTNTIQPYSVAAKAQGRKIKPGKPLLRAASGTSSFASNLRVTH